MVQEALFTKVSSLVSKSLDDLSSCAIGICMDTSYREFLPRELRMTG